MSVPHTVPHNVMDGLEKPGLLQRMRLLDWAWGLFVVLGATVIYLMLHHMMSNFQIAVLSGWATVLVGFGWYWRPFQALTVAVAALSVLGIALYGSQFSNGQTDPILHWWLSSATAIMWSSGLFWAAFLAYLLGLVVRSDHLSERALSIGSVFAWAAVTMALTALMVRWRESYLFGPGFGMIPIEDLFDVFVLFNIMTGLLYLFFETRFRQRSLGAMAMSIICASTLFLVFLEVKFNGAAISMVNPELRSYWIKIHVPVLFVSYGSFAFAAMVGTAYLLRSHVERTNPNGRIARRLPDLETIDDVMYRYNALGFVFIALGIILGALWAEQAWGAYWSWDPKETEALIVLLNYAAWLHMRFTKGWRGKTMAWWSIIGMIVMTAGFVGVDVFLPGLHSFGKL